MVATSPDLKEPPSAAMVNYVHLRISTEYSVACSTIRIDTLLQQCAQIGLPAASNYRSGVDVRHHSIF